MESQKNLSESVYRILFILFIVVYISTFVLFSLMETDEPVTEEGFFITPGDYNQEWLIAILPVPIIIFVSGFVSIFLFFNIGIKLYIRYRRRKGDIGLISLPKAQREISFRRIFARAVILCFFFANLSSIFASSELIVSLMRSVYPYGYTGISPDPEVLWQLVWLFSIPSTLLVVPFWILRDTGLGIVKKDKETGMESVVFVGDRLYGAIQGYAGIGFLLSLFFSIFTFVADFNWAPNEFVAIFTMIISPVIAICFTLPFIIYIDKNMSNYKAKLLVQLKNSKIYQELVSKVDKI